MLKDNVKLWSQKGSMMVEALAMLGLITMVTPILYKKAAERTTELQDINTAAQMRTVSKALDDYIKDNYVELTTSGPAIRQVTPAELEAYLPYGFNLADSKLFSGYNMSMKRTIVDAGTSRQHASITAMTVAPVKGTLPAIRSAKIASMVGANGGVVMANRAQGVQGGWNAALSDYNIAATANGSLATSSVHAINASSGVGADHVLFRDDSRGDIEYNTMQVNLYMGGNSIAEVNRLIAGANGQVTITGNETGAPAKKANLGVEGAATIADLLTAGSANIATGLLTVNTTDKVKVTDKLTVTQNGIDVTGPSALKGDTTITGAATVNTGKFTANEAAEIKKGLTVSGGSAATGNSNTYSLAVKKTSSSAADGSLLVENNARINNDLYVGGKFEADKIYGRTELGGGLISPDNYNFVATSANVIIQSDAFKVGNRLQTTATAALMSSAAYKVDLQPTYGQLSNTAGTVGFKVAGTDVSATATGTATVASANGKLVLNSAGGTMTGVALGIAGTTSAYISGNNNKQKINLAADSVAITNTAGNGSNIYVNKDDINIEQKSSAKTSFIKLANNLINVDTNNAIIDDRKIVFADGASTLGNFTDGNFDNAVMNKGVLVRREGMINLAAASNSGSKSGRSALAAGDGDQKVAGYIKLDRMLANQVYKYPGTGEYSTGVAAGEAYDAYQVNPAYTSVMHDIKLTTRGGARLSDVLPDFINKGIYVIDNTYKEPSSGNRSWENYKVSVSGGRVVVENQPTDCGGNANCITTPWLGFVPTPQCPPGYSKVITISPIRWKMAEAYTIAMDPSGVTDPAEKFKSFFIAPRNPKTARFELAEANGAAGNHTHEVEQGMPLTFQTNTWLNTTISGVRAGSTANTSGNVGTIRNGDFLGWHAIMGFLYHGSDYQDYIISAGGAAAGAATKGKIVWNLFPVYNEELTAIANVYCYFERRNMTTTPKWSWDAGVVDTKYDQLVNFRNAFDKNNANAAYINRLNDPALKYNDPW